MSRLGDIALYNQLGPSSASAKPLISFLLGSLVTTILYVVSFSSCQEYILSMSDK